jgi:transcription initiation factor TFIID TATA-box-binding protein
MDTMIQEGATLLDPSTNTSSAELPEIRTHNIVCTTFLGCKLDLALIARHARNAEYNPRRFGAVIIRIRDPKTTALIFSTGKMVVVGAKTLPDSALAARRFVRMVQKIGFDVRFDADEYKVQNMVAGVTCGWDVRLEGLALEWRERGGYEVMYESQLFAGAVCRVQCSRSVVVCLMFTTGKAIFTGAKCREDIESALEELFPYIKQYRFIKPTD